jgi:signal transduction histidine kinase/ligand-binding sensor domain-containing protein
MRRKILLIFCVFLMPAVLFSQDFRILHWGIENGLSQGINQKIIRDSEGFLWATSYEGVNRFDGKTFRPFYSFPQKRNSIKGTETVGLVEDSLHKIWIGSGNGLNRYDPVTDSVTTFSLQVPSVKPVPEYIIPIVGNANEVICYTISGELIGYGIHNFTKRIIARNIPWYDDYVNVNNSYYEASSQELWMPVESGIMKINLINGATTHYLPGIHINAIIPSGSSWSFFLGTDNGLAEWNIESNRYLPFSSFYGQTMGKITCFAKDFTNGNIWIGTEEHGLFILSLNNKFTHISSASEPTPIRGNKINSIYCDNSGITWISVSTNGIEQLIPGNRFTHFSENIQVGNNLNNNVVRSFIEDSNKNIWIATQGGGINVFNPAARQFSSITKKQVPGLPFDFIRYMVKDENERAWIGTEKGMCRMNMSTKATDRIHFSNINHISLPDPYIEQIIPWQNNQWLIATKEYGLFELKKDSTIARQLPFPGNKHVFYAAYVNNLLFVSVWDNDPKLFLVKGTQWQEQKKDITAFTITYVLHDKPAKKYWIGTLKGLLETDEDLNILHHYTRDDGLSNHYIYAMVMDRDSILWISTNRGLSQFNTKTRTFRVFTPSDGLQGYEYNAKAGFMAVDGSLYFGGTNGFDVIRPAVSTTDAGPARFYIRDLLVNNISWSGERNINHISSIHLPYSGNNITIQTGIIDFTSSGINKIRYKLENIDADWKIADRDFSINYSGLPPGEYSFVATAANMNNEWNSAETRIHFNIAKPWWQTWWFRISLIAVIGASVTFAIRSYYKRQLLRQRTEFEKKQAVEHERTRIATDMHDDMGAGLSRIKFLSETIGIKKQHQQPIEEDLGKIREYSHDMIDKMGEIVWALNEKNDSLHDLLSYTRAYAVDYLSQNGIKCTVQIPEHYEDAGFVSGEFRRNVYLSVKEALHNIVKHSQAANVNIEVRINDRLIISIRDDGTGFDEKNIRPFSNGFTSMKKRMEVMGGHCSISGTKGTTVKLEVPLEK